MRSANSVHFVIRFLPRADLPRGGLRVLELGSLDPWGGYRDVVNMCAGNEYIGVDITAGPGVDKICTAEEITRVFGKDSFDVIIATELLEHVEDWRRAVSSIKNACRPGGRAILTMRSRGFGYHGVPRDYWRFEASDVECMFSDCEIIALEQDPDLPGVFVVVERPKDFVENDLSGFDVYSIVRGGRVPEITSRDYRRPHFLGILMVSKARFMLSWIFSYEKKDLWNKARLQLDEARSLWTAAKALRSRGEKDSR